MKGLLIAATVLVWAIAGAVLIVAGMARTGQFRQTPPAPEPAPVSRSFTVNGWTYDCAQVRQSVAAGEDYTPDGHLIYSVLLMDCDI